jgi:hypothetical protein
MRSLAILALMVGLTGCFSEPLDKPGSVGTDVRLLGTWDCVSVGKDGQQAKATLTVVRFDDYQYYGEWRDSAELSRYRAYGIRVGSTTLLNVTELHGRFTPWPWSVVKAVVESHTLSLALVNARALRAADEKHARQEIRTRVQDSQIYQPFAECTAEKE